MSLDKDFNQTNPDLLFVGFFCHDRHEEGLILGGTASYSSLIANQLKDHSVAVLTSLGKDFLFLNKFEESGIEVCIKPAEKTTVFSNIYKDGNRTQYIHARAETLTEADLPKHWKNIPLVKICLIADEVDHSLMKAFPNSLIAATIQGLVKTMG